MPPRASPASHLCPAPSVIPTPNSRTQLLTPGIAMTEFSLKLERLWWLSAIRNPLQVISFPALQLHMSRTAMRASQEDFENAMNQVKLLKKDPGNEVKLKLYALYKQATEGPCNIDLINKANGIHGMFLAVCPRKLPGKTMWIWCLV